MGNAIVEEARKLIGPFRFVLSVHPMDFRSWPYRARNWGEYARTLKPQGFDVREPSDPWLPYMVASDIVLTDHTSLAVYGAPVGRPSVFVPLEGNLLTENSAIWRLWQMSPTLKNPRALGETLLSALRDYPYGQLAYLAKDINACPGRSAERVREEVYRLLRLEPAWAAAPYPIEPLAPRHTPAQEPALPSLLPANKETAQQEDIA